MGVSVLACDFRHDKVTGEGAQQSSGAWYAKVQAQVFTPHCVACHGTSGNVNLESYEAIKADLDRIYQAAIVERSMPKGGNLDQESYDLLAEWIKAGAPLDSPTPEPSPSPDPLLPLFSSIKSHIIDVRCVACHNPTGEGKNVPMQTLGDLLNSPRDLVLPGDPDDSGLVIAIMRTDAKRMPPPKTGGPLTDTEISTIRQWIQDGAKP